MLRDLMIYLTGASLLALMFPAAAESDKRPNIVLIMCDDMGYSDIGSYGGEVDTPNLDRLAREGLRFRHFYNNAKCEHTRASLITGHWWHHVGASATVVYKGKTFGTRLREAGYRTMKVGKTHLNNGPKAHPLKHGFDHSFFRSWFCIDPPPVCPNTESLGKHFNSDF